MKLDQAKKIIRYFKRAIRVIGQSADIETVGSVRRKKPFPEDIDLLIIKYPEDEMSIKIGRQTFTHDRKGSVAVDTPRVRGALTDGGGRFHYFDGRKWQQVDIFAVPPESRIYGLFTATGPWRYNVRVRRIAKLKGLLLNQYGLFNKRGAEVLFPTSEADIQDFLGIKQRRPEERY